LDEKLSMHNRSTIRVSFLVCVIAGLGACSAPQLDVIPRVQQASLSGTIGEDTSGTPVADIDVADDLGLGDTSTEFGARADLSFGAGKWTFAYSPASFSGDGTLTGDITHGGVTIPAGTPVSSDVQMDVGSAIWTYDFVPSETVELGLGLGVHAIDFKGTVTDGIDTVKLDQTVPVPVLAARAGVAFGQFDISALLSGLQVKDGSDEATFYDSDVMGRWHFLGGNSGHLSIALVLGWHRTDVKLDYTDSTDRVNADLSVTGIYYGLSIGF